MDSPYTRPPIPPHPGRAYSNGNLRSANHEMHAAGSSNVQPPIPPHPRANTAPSVFQYPQDTRPPVPQRPSIPQRPYGRPRTAPGRHPTLPPSLMPGASTGRSNNEGFGRYEGDLFFQHRPPPPIPPHHPRRSTVSAERAHSPDAPPIPPPPPPAIPPKPFLPTESVSEPSSSTATSPFPPTLRAKAFDSCEALVNGDSGDVPARSSRKSAPTSPAVDEYSHVLAHTLELSAREQSNRADQRESDDEILARVLEESLASSKPGSGVYMEMPGITKSKARNSAAETVDSSLGSGSFSALSLSRSSSSKFTDNTPPSSIPHSPIRESANGTIRGSSIAQRSPTEVLEEESAFQRELKKRERQMQMDEELARRLAEEDAAMGTSTPAPVPSNPPEPTTTSTPAQRSPVKPTLGSISNASTLPAPASPPLPRYEDAVNSAARPPLPSAIPAPAQMSTVPSQSSFSSSAAVESEPASLHPVPLSASLSSHTYSSTVTYPQLPNLGRAASAQAVMDPSAGKIPNAVTGGPVEGSGTPLLGGQMPQASYVTRPNTVIPVQRAQSANAILPTKPKLGINDLSRMTANVPKIDSSILESPEESVDSHDHGPPNESGRPSPILEDELLTGVSFGFSPPQISLRPMLMQGPIPNLIALPYGKCPPLHIQAPTWKHLLRLLTRLSESRIEPTIEALAGTKTKLKLRTVVQFVRVHQSSNEWRTIVYLTIDVPIPPQTPNSFKYTNGDVCTLPWSYKMTPLPALLRDNADSPLAKWYTVPASDNTPYPELPMKLPNFAMYLQAVLQDSRRAMNDSSSGLRRLAKTVDTIYPPTSDSIEGLGPEHIAPDRLRVGNFFRRALGRGDRNNNQRGGNEDTYEFITPFRIDEYQ